MGERKVSELTSRCYLINTFSRLRMRMILDRCSKMIGINRSVINLGSGSECSCRFIRLGDILGCSVTGILALLEISFVSSSSGTVSPELGGCGWVEGQV